MKDFFYNYLRSMRLYYGFVTGTTTLFGCLASGRPLADGRTALLFTMGFLAWGFNQIFSDWYDRHEDAVNAPHRPMVTGALRPIPAFAVSLAGLAAIAVTGFFLSPWTLVFLGIGGVLNISYSLLKRVPVLNCLVYACAISCCALFGWAGSAGTFPSLHVYGQIAPALVPVHFLMCHNSYYKDVAGDRATGVRTLQTLCPPLAMAVSLGLVLYALAFLCTCAAMSPARLSLLMIVIVLAVLFFAALHKRRMHLTTSLNCQLCVALLHVQSFYLSWPVCILSLAGINLLFMWYRDEKE